MWLWLLTSSPRQSSLVCIPSYGVSRATGQAGQEKMGTMSSNLNVKSWLTQRHNCQDWGFIALLQACRESRVALRFQLQRPGVALKLQLVRPECVLAPEHLLKLQVQWPGRPLEGRWEGPEEPLLKLHRQCPESGS